MSCSASPHLAVRILCVRISVGARLNILVFVDVHFWGSPWLRACGNTAFYRGFCHVALRADDSARVYTPADRCYYYCYLHCYLRQNQGSATFGVVGRTS